VSGTLLCLLEDLVLFRRGQTAADGAGLLGAEVERQVLLVLVEQAELRPLLKVDNGQGAGDRLAEVVDSVQLATGGGDLLDAELAEVGLELGQSLDELFLALVPELAALNLGSRLFAWSFS